MSGLQVHSKRGFVYKCFFTFVALEEFFIGLKNKKNQKIITLNSPKLNENMEKKKFFESEKVVSEKLT